jgi:uncharacterized repeat protein (TIGR01451 family)
MFWLLRASKDSEPTIGSYVASGDRITYTIWVTNVGNIPAINVPITDSIPAGTSFVFGSDIPPVVSGPDPLVWTLPSAEPGVAYSFSFAVVVTGLTGSGSILNVAYVGNSPVTPTNEIVHVFVPTAISLVSLTATRGLDLDGYPIVTVAWVIASESNTLGYRVLRSETSDRMSATVASNGIIAAYGDGGTYAWVDAEALTSRGYYYWLEEIELDGQTVTDYGPAYAPLVQSYRSYLPAIR